MELAVRERGVYLSIGSARSHTEGYWDNLAAPYSWHEWRPDDPSNSAMVDDPILNDAVVEFAKYFMLDDNKAYAAFGSVVPHILEQAYYLPLPQGFSYTVWWPWVRGYSGEDMFGATDRFEFVNYIWLDQVMKESMGR